MSRFEQDTLLNQRNKKGIPKDFSEKQMIDRFGYHNSNKRDEEFNDDNNNNDNNDNNDDNNFDEYNTNSSSKLKFKSKLKRGEITGEDMQTDEAECGMPIRSSYYGKKITKNPLKSKSNRLDFDLYNEDTIGEGTNENKVKYYDPSSRMGDSNLNNLTGSDNFGTLDSGASYSRFDIRNTDTVIPELYGSDSGSFISNNSNKFVIQFNNLLQEQLNNTKFCVSAFSLYTLFGALYIMSKGKTEAEIYDYFGMISKDNIYDGLEYINKIKDKLADQIVLKHIIFVNNNHKINPQLVDYLKKIVSINQIATNYADKEYNTINAYINKISSGTISPISKKVIENADILCSTIGYIKPIWTQPFEKSFDTKFKLLDGRYKMARMLSQNDGQFDYCEDNINQILEIKCVDKLSMGIILPKDFVEPNVKNIDITTYIKELKPTSLDQVCIPSFTEQIKIKFTNILYQSGLRSVFINMNLPEFIKDDVHISDIVQNITVIVANTNNANNNKRLRMRSGISNVRFIADHPFIYYFRLVPTNTLILMGYFT